VKKLIICLVIAGLLFTACGSLSGENIWTERRPVEEGPDLTGLALTPGVFTGRATGFHGEVIAVVTIDETGTIAGIEVEAPGETADFYQPAFAQMVPAMLSAQSASVDTYTGATFSSAALIEAVQQALIESGGGSAAAPAVEDEPAPPVEGEIFVGAAEGYYGEITVAVTVNAGQIAAIEVTDHSETPGIANPAFAQLIEAVLAAQSTDVDAVTNATGSSRGFIAAVESALAQFVPDAVFYVGVAEGYNGDITLGVQVEDGQILAIAVIEHSETPGIANPAFAQLTEAVLAAQSAGVDTITDATYTSQAFITAVRSALALAGVVGEIFVGVGSDGYGGDITVSVTVDEGAILAVSVTEHSETPGVANPAFAQLVEAVLAAQSADVDTVTDATYTSRAFIAAVQDALAQAG